jgi:hypothetical protein
LRYGNIVKTILKDFEKVKKKLLVPDSELPQEAHRLKLLITKQLEREFPIDTEKIKTNVGRKTLTSEQLNMYENQIKFMNLLSKIMIKIRKEVEIQRYEDLFAELVAEEQVESMKEEVITIKSRVMKMRMRFSDQELNDMNDEILRVLLVISYKILQTQMKRERTKLNDNDEARLGRVRKIIESGERIGKYVVSSV